MWGAIVTERVAGRELDAEVAEKVMGRPVGEWLEGIYYQDGRRGRIPRFSTDIAAAWQVVEKLAADTPAWPHHGYFVSIHNSTGLGRWEARIGATAIAHAHTAPLAICLAALAACGEAT
jgi:hypothetical protein